MPGTYSRNGGRKEISNPKFSSHGWLRMDGKFERVSTRNFDFFFERGKINPEKVSALAAVNEKSVNFLLDLFKAEKLQWHKPLTVYFRDYDSKLFYTHHWGKGASSDAGIFMVFDGTTPNFGLAAHENAHSLVDSNWASMRKPWRRTLLQTIAKLPRS